MTIEIFVVAPFIAKNGRATIVIGILADVPVELRG